MLPDIAPGLEGTVVEVTSNERGAPVPHTLVAATEIVPLLIPAVALMEVDVELPLHPGGNVQE